jgi:hypothetical protein
VCAERLKRDYERGRLIQQGRGVSKSRGRGWMKTTYRYEW